VETTVAEAMLAAVGHTSNISAESNFANQEASKVIFIKQAESIKSKKTDF